MDKLTIIQRIRYLPKVIWYFMRGYVVAVNVAIRDGGFSVGIHENGLFINCINTRSINQRDIKSKKVNPYV